MGAVFCRWQWVIVCVFYLFRAFEVSLCVVRQRIFSLVAHYRVAGAIVGVHFRRFCIERNVHG